MPTTEALQLTDTRQRLEAVCADLSASTFSDVNLSAAAFENVNLSGATIHNACLRGLAITDANTEGMTIEGVLVSDLQAAYRATRA